MMKAHRVLNWVNGILKGKFDDKVIDLPFVLIQGSVWNKRILQQWQWMMEALIFPGKKCRYPDILLR
jgi:hypothetical protein